MSKFIKWFRSPKATPLQLFLLFCGIFYFIYTSTELLNEIPELLRVAIYLGLMLLTILAGASFIDAKRMGLLVKRIARDRNKTDKEKIDEIINVIDEALYHASKILKKKKKR